MSLKYEPVSVEIESCTDLVQLSIPEIESWKDAGKGTWVVKDSRPSEVRRRIATSRWAFCYERGTPGQLSFPEQVIDVNMQWFRGRLAYKALRLL
jgi:hypothetical protein